MSKRSPFSAKEATLAYAFTLFALYFVIWLGQTCKAQLEFGDLHSECSGFRRLLQLPQVSHLVMMTVASPIAILFLLLAEIWQENERETSACRDRLERLMGLPPG